MIPTSGVGNDKAKSFLPNAPERSELGLFGFLNTDLIYIIIDGVLPSYILIKLPRVSWGSGLALNPRSSLTFINLYIIYNLYLKTRLLLAFNWTLLVIVKPASFAKLKMVVIGHLNPGEAQPIEVDPG
jgi:hypothetical protein